VLTVGPHLAVTRERGVGLSAAAAKGRRADAGRSAVLALGLEVGHAGKKGGGGEAGQGGGEEMGRARDREVKGKFFFHFLNLYFAQIF